MLKTKNQKPIDIDAHLKYRCPSCGSDHWLSLRETQTKNFKVVCYCNTVFKPKTIKKIDIVFVSQKPTININHETKETIDPELLDKSSKILIDYGFTTEEAKSLIQDTFKQNPTNNCVELIKIALESFGVNNVESDKTN